MDLEDAYDTEATGRLDLTSVTAGLVLAGRYRLEALLAHSRGVMTWRASDQVLSRPVLIHLLEPDDERLGWILQAARRAATVTDSRFLRVLDALEASGQEPWSFVVCEYAVGDSLATLLTHGPLTGQQAGCIVRDVAAALAPLHARGLFHLRISPESVIITANGNVKIVGFLIDAALRPEPGEDSLSWSEQESVDTRGLGALLYAASTARWPVPPSEPQRPYWGLAPAPLAGLVAANRDASEQVWASPHELNPPIDPELSAVTMAILRGALGLVGPQLSTADDIADSLDGVLGAGAADESLEDLVRGHQGMSQTPTTPAVIHQSTWAGHDDGPPTKPMPAVTPSPPRPVPPAAHVPVASAQPVVGPQQPATPLPPRPRPVAAPPRQRPGATVGALGRRWVVPLVAFVAVALVVLQVRGCTQTPSTQPTIGAGQSDSALVEPVDIVSAFDFDPQADGGDANENSDQAQLAADGDASTVWRTLTYLNNPVFGGLKPGVGMVFDLGREVPVASVSLILDNQPNVLSLMVPRDADPSESAPPMDSVDQWQVIASDPAAGLQVSLSLDEPVTTRWVMVYFTQLPPVGASLYRSGIAEAYINR